MTIWSSSCEQAATKFSATSAGEGQVFLVASVLSPADAVQAAGEVYGRIAEVLREHHLEELLFEIDAEAAVRRKGAEEGVNGEW